MASSAQINANRENATLSTGPRTAEGKATSSQNARKHGFNSSELLIPEHLREEFQEHRESLDENLQPFDALSRDLFAHLLHASWNIRRIELLQLDALSADDPFADPAAHPRLQLLMRYHAHFHRIYQRVLRTYQQYHSNAVALIHGVPEKLRDTVPLGTHVATLQKARVNALRFDREKAAPSAPRWS